MRQRLKTIIITSFVLIILTLFLVDYLSDKEEKFIISDFTANIIYPETKTTAGCFKMNSFKNGSESKGPKILAIKFNLKYLSVNREHLFNHMPPGGEGPNDQIKSIEIIDKNGVTLNKSFLTDASEYKNFDYKNVSFDKNGHSVSMNGCLCAETFKNTHEFINYYNYNSDKESKFRDVTMGNYHFFILNDSCVKNNLNDLKLKFLFQDGRTIIRKIM